MAKTILANFILGLHLRREEPPGARESIFEDGMRDRRATNIADSGEPETLKIVLAGGWRRRISDTRFDFLQAP
jgi:hypothetical protein